MREAGRLVAKGLDLVRKMAKPGITSLEIDAAVEELFCSAGGEPIFKGYGATFGRPAFPATICASFNEQVVHGVPDGRKLKTGDILSIDMGVRLKNYCGDAAITVAVGQIDNQTRSLIDTTRRALDVAIDMIRPGLTWHQVAKAIQECIENAGFSVIRAFTGHGIGQKMHEEPQLPNYITSQIDNFVIQKGMTLAIEPMVNAGSPGVRTLKNGWTAVTTDGSLSAHFEHTVAVTEDRAVALTLP